MMPVQESPNLRPRIDIVPEALQRTKLYILPDDT